MKSKKETQKGFNKINYDCSRNRDINNYHIIHLPIKYYIYLISD